MDTRVEKHSPLKSVVLHLLPGILTGAVYFALAPVVRRGGYPTVMAIILAGIFVIIPFELGLLFYQRKKTGERFFNGIVRYTKALPFWQYLIIIPGILVLSAAMFKILEFSSVYLESLFGWLPSDLLLNMGLDGEYEKGKLLLTYILFLIFIVFIGPVTEEFYFRGYLLPRMPVGLKGWTEISHSFLFALYHTWTPWMLAVRTFGILPLVYAVRRKENIWLGIVAHCLLNSMDFIIGASFLLKLG
jgi:membrane protease YdiL (CAAX protease family)